MDRFFSKLDLRDIKIDPFNTSFPPDAEEVEPEPEPHQVGKSEQVPPPTAETTAVAVAPAEDRAGDDAAETWVAAEAAVAEPGGWERTEGSAWAPPAAPPPSNGRALHHAESAGVEEAVFAADAAPASVASADAAPIGEGSEVLKVSARSRPSAVAGAIAGVVRENGRAEVQAIGAGATNQAVKACAIARDYLRETGIEAVCLPAFIDVTIENEDRTAIRLVVEPR